MHAPTVFFDLEGFAMLVLKMLCCCLGASVQQGPSNHGNVTISVKCRQHLSSALKCFRPCNRGSNTGPPSATVGRDTVPTNFFCRSQSEGTFYFSSSGLLQQGSYKPDNGWQGVGGPSLGTAAAVQ